ncbi:MAG: hypothetical protein DRJ47_04820 [Thermoprotei archaeon]|nr:MAG: hypothetical protein DRJ47_04820 [Thermoprotei archaeon]
MKNRSNLMVLILIMLVLIGFIQPLSIYSQPSGEWRIIPLSLENIDKHLKFFTGLQSRFTGYEGFYTAADYIYNYLYSLGLNVTREEFTVVVPIEQYAYIRLEDGTVFKAHMFYPTGIDPANALNVSGRLVYVGKATLEELEGQEINGSIVLVDYDSLWDWRLLPMLGAKAVIFIETPVIEKAVPRTFGEYKIISIPTGFPRLYVNHTVGEILKEASKRGVKATVNSKMSWEEKEGYNIWTIIPGTDPRLKEEYVIIAAHYDTFSVVPAVSPGASDSISIALLLELARVLRENPPPRTIVLVAFGGHWQYLAGPRYFTEARFRELEENKGFMRKVKLMISLDISTASDSVSLRNFGYGYWTVDTQTGMLIRYSWIRQMANDAVKELKELTGKSYNFYNVLVTAPPGEELYQTLLNLLSEVGDLYPAMLDVEPWTVAGGLGITFRTARSLYPYLTTPFDTYDKLNYFNLLPQLEVLEAVLSKILSAPFWNPLATPIYRRINLPDLGFCSLTIRIWRYDVKTAQYSPVEGALVVAAPIGTTMVSPRATFPFIMIAKTNENGEANFIGFRYNDRVLFTGFYLDENGRIIGLSPYSGPGSMGMGSLLIHSVHTDFTQSMSFNVSRITIFGSGFSTTLVAILSHWALDARTHYIPQPYYYGRTFDSYDEVIYVPPNIPLEILAYRSSVYAITAGSFGWMVTVVPLQPSGLIAGIKEPAPEGSGFVLKPGENMWISYAPLRLAQETWYLDEFRLAPVKWANISTQALALLYHNMAEKELKQAWSYIRNYGYDKAITHMIIARQFEVNAYYATRTFLTDVLQMAVIYFILVIPFSWLLVNLIVREKATFKGKIILFLAVNAMFDGIFVALHPTTMLATNTFMVLAGYIAMILGLVTTIIIFSRGYGQLKEVRKERIGLHFVEFERTSAIGAAVNISLGHMNRRPLRTALTLISVVVVGFSMLTFSSVSITIAPAIIRQPPLENIPYEGVLYRTLDFGVIPLEQVKFLKQAFSDEAIISVRAWLYPPGGEIYLTAPGKTTSALLRGILAVSPEENLFTKIDDAIISGEWFDPWDYRTCIISDDIANALGLKVGDTLDLFGVKLVVKGIFDSTVIDTMHDIDRWKLTPVNLKSPYKDPLQADFVIIVPFKLAEDLLSPATSSQSYEIAYTLPGVRSIAFKPVKGSIRKLAEKIALITQGTVWVSEDGAMYTLSINPSLRMLGTGEAFIVLLLAVLVLLSTIIGSIVERVREIGILSSIGLSPSHIATLYLVEMIVYGLLGGIIGYVVSLLFSASLALLNIPTAGLYTNYTSSGTLTTLGIMFFSIISIALYPAYKASKLVTPSLERRWKPPTKPKGDEWMIPLPLRLASTLEALAFMEFIREYLEYRKAERVGSYQILELDFKWDKQNKLLELKGRTQLAPWDQGITQIFALRGMSLEGAGYNFELYLKRLTGPLAGWIISNRSLIEDVRFQILMWRSLREDDRSRYIKKAEKMLGR